jgi:RNA polymerase sigma-70 factor (ECF subfamily)
MSDPDHKPGPEPTTDSVPAERLREELETEPPPEEFLVTDEVKHLVSAAQDGDAAALNELFERYHGTMVEYARRQLGARLRSKEDPMDLAQTTFREAARDFQGYVYRGEGSFLRWLARILQNKIRDKAEFYSAGKRDMTRERPLEARAPGADDDAPGFEAPTEDLSVTRQVQRSEEYEILREAIEELKPDHRQAITLVVFQGMTLRQAGEEMGGRTEDAVRMMLRRAEKALADLTRDRLERLEE